jgi:hypothetical protein
MASVQASAIKAGQYVADMQRNARIIANRYNVPLPAIFEQDFSLTTRFDRQEQVTQYQALVAEVLSAQMELFAAALDKIAADKPTRSKANQPAG